MDAFNLHWPGGDATLQTDGTRCRVVWRAANGMGGSIENSEQAKRRVAAGLGFAPGLLDELRGAGHTDLAAEIERLAPPPKADAPRPESTRAARAASEPAAAPRATPAREAPPAKPPRHEPTPARPKAGPPAQEPRSRIARWLDALPDAPFEACGARRAAKWHHGKSWPEGLSLKTPLAGKGDWVLKIADDETRYVAAEHFAGICRALVAQRSFANDAFVDAFFEGCKALRQKEVAAAREAWESTRR